MRLFTAIPLPLEMEKNLLEMQDKSIQGVRWQSQNNLHLTLVFIGDVDEEKGERIKRQLANVLMPSFSINIRGIGSFPLKKRPRVVWVGVEQSEPLIELQKSINEVIESCDVIPDDRPYTPHITIGKVKLTDKAILDRYLREYKDALVGKIDVNQFSLFESKLSSAGAIHTRIASYPAKDLL